MPDEVLPKAVNVAFDFHTPALAIDATEVFVFVAPGNQVSRVMLLGAQVSPVIEPDGTMKGSVASKWVMDPETARVLASQILAKLNQAENVGVNAGGTGSDGGSSDPNQ